MLAICATLPYRYLGTTTIHTVCLSWSLTHISCRAAFYGSPDEFLSWTNSNFLPYATVRLDGTVLVSNWTTSPQCLTGAAVQCHCIYKTLLFTLFRILYLPLIFLPPHSQLEPSGIFTVSVFTLGGTWLRCCGVAAMHVWCACYARTLPFTQKEGLATVSLKRKGDWSYVSTIYLHSTPERIFIHIPF